MDTDKKITLIISIVSISIAFLTLAYTSYYSNEQIRITIEHNKLSVTPKLGSNLIINSNKAFSGIGLVNDGLGPAIVKNVKYFDGKYWLDLLPITAQEKMLETFQLKQYVTSIPLNPDSIIKPDKTVWLFKSNVNKREIANGLFNMYQRSAIYVCYCSLYKECESKIISGNKNIRFPESTCKY